MLLLFGFLLGYTGPEALILSSNLPSALIDQAVIDKKLAEDLQKSGGSYQPYPPLHLITPWPCSKARRGLAKNTPSFVPQG